MKKYKITNEAVSTALVGVLVLIVFCLIYLLTRNMPSFSYDDSQMKTLDGCVGDETITVQVVGQSDGSAGDNEVRGALYPEGGVGRELCRMPALLSASPANDVSEFDFALTRDLGECVAVVENAGIYEYRHWTITTREQGVNLTDIVAMPYEVAGCGD